MSVRRPGTPGDASGIAPDTMSALRRWLAEEDGQDLIEYALLSSFIGFAGAAALSALGDSMQTWYAGENAYQQETLYCLEVPEPKPEICVGP